MCYLYFFCLHCLINIHNFDYPDSRLSGLFTQVPPSPDNRGSTVVQMDSALCIPQDWKGTKSGHVITLSTSHDFNQIQLKASLV